MKLSRFAFTAALYAAAEAGARAAQALALLWLARLSTKEQYGELGLALALQQVVTILVLGGTVQATSSLLNQFRGERTSILLSNAWNLQRTLEAGILMLCVAVFAIFPGLFPGSLGPLEHVLVLAMGLLTADATLAASLLRLEEKHDRALMARALPQLLCYGGALVGATLHADIVTGFLAGAVAGLGLWHVSYSISGSNPKAPGGPSRHTMEALFRLGLPWAVVGLVGWISGYGNNIAIGALFTKRDVADFTVVFSITSVVVLGLGAVTQVWSPRFLAIASESDRQYLEQRNLLVNQFMTLLCGALSGLIVLGFRDLAGLAGGNFVNYIGLEPYLATVGAAYVIFTLHYRSQNYYMVEQAGGAYMRISVVTGFIGAGISLLAMLSFGVWGAYIGFLLMLLIRGGALFVNARRKWGVKLSLLEIPAGLSLLFTGLALSQWPAVLVARLAVFTLAVAIVFGAYVVANLRIIRAFDVRPM